MNLRNVEAFQAILGQMSLVHAARQPDATDEQLAEALAMLLASNGALVPEALTDEEAFDVPAGVDRPGSYYERRTLEQIGADVRDALAKLAAGEKVEP